MLGLATARPYHLAGPYWARACRVSRASRSDGAVCTTSAWIQGAGHHYVINQAKLWNPSDFSQIYATMDRSKHVTTMHGLVFLL